MAFLDSILNFFVPAREELPETAAVVPAPATEYEIRPLTEKHQKEVMQLNLRCFANGENYTKHTFSYLLNEPNVLSYRVVTPAGEMVAFIFVMLDDRGAGHITTIGVAPEHRRRRLAEKLLHHIEKALKNRAVETLMLEVRVSNTPAQNLYHNLGYMIVQRIKKYYNNGEDCFLMMKPLN